MKIYLSLTAVLLLLTVNINAQDSITLDKHNASINIGDSLLFAVGLTVQPGFDASVFLDGNSNPNPYSVTVSPSIINYPYSTPIAATFKTLKYYKRGTYTVYVSATIGSVVVSDSCIVEVINPTPWRIFNLQFFETRPSHITVDKNGTIYYSEMPPEGDKIYSTGVRATTINNPIFEGKGVWSVSTNGGVWQTISDDETETLYFFTNQGLQFYKGSNTTIYNKSNSIIPDNVIKQGCIDAQGRVWLGTLSGLASYSNYTITTYDKTNSILGTEEITALALGVDNRLWIGTANGLIVKDGDNWVHYTPDNSGLPASYISNLIVDKNGVIWMGVKDIGLVSFDGTNWTQFNSSNSPLTSNYVAKLTVDKKGNLWVATANHGFLSTNAGCGLLKYDGTAWTKFTTSNSLLPDNEVQWVGADRYGNIWFVCRTLFGVYNEDGIPFLVNDVSEQPEPSDGITISPNPASTSFTISGIEGVSSVKILTMLGMEVKQLSRVNGQLSIDVSDLASGVYFVQFRSQTGVVSKPIVVSR